LTPILGGINEEPPTETELPTPHPIVPNSFRGNELPNINPVLLAMAFPTRTFSSIAVSINPLGAIIGISYLTPWISGKIPLAPPKWSIDAFE
jgi:hypothetical protein